MYVDNLLQDVFQTDLLTFGILCNQLIDLQLQFITRNTSVNETKILRNDLIEQETAQCRFYIAG